MTNIEKRLWTANDAAAYLGYKSANSVYKLIAEGHLPTVTLPGRGGTRIDKKDLDAFLERRKSVA
jgi:excisionase family DNA binding protein